MFRLLASMLLILSASACQTLAPIESLNNIEIGMTKAQVANLAGAPNHRHIKSNQEAWEYCHNGWLVDDYSLIWFDGDSVVGKELQPDYEVGLCVSPEKNFDWSRAPTG